MRNLLAFAALAALAAPVAAASTETHSVAVSIGDLDLNSPAGRAALKSRVGRAADKVCGSNDARGVAAYRAYRSCRDSAVRSALGE